MGKVIACTISYKGSPVTLLSIKEANPSHKSSPAMEESCLLMLPSALGKGIEIIFSTTKPDLNF